MPLELDHRLRRSFAVRELRCPCGCGYGLELEDYEEVMLDGIQAMRDRVGRPLGVNSALRCPIHNAAVGGVPRSTHQRALAVDFGTASTFERRELVDAAVELEVPGIGVARGFIHCDWDRSGLVPRPGIWSY